MTCDYCGTAPRPGDNRCDSCGAPLPRVAPDLGSLLYRGRPVTEAELLAGAVEDGFPIEPGAIWPMP